MATASATSCESAPGIAADGPIRLLTHLRYFGYGFNPVSFYYCFDAADRTARRHRRRDHQHALGRTPLLRAAAGGQPWRTPDRLRFQFDKDFHVSPFLPMDMHYDWRFTAPGDSA